MLGILPVLELPLVRDWRLRLSVAAMVENYVYKWLHEWGWVPLNIAVCEENLRVLHRVFAEHEVPFWLENGTSLGVVREGGIIPYDDDVDIGMWGKYRDTFLDHILPDLRKEGFYVGQVKGHTFFVLLRKGEKVDVSMIDTHSPGAMCDAPGSKKDMDTCAKQAYYMRRVRPVTFLGRTFWVPPDDYMVYGYGKNWRTHDWRRDCKKSLSGKTCVDTAPPSSPAA